MNNNRHCRKHICHIGWCVQFNLCSHLSKLMLRYISGSNFPIPEKIRHGIFISVNIFLYPEKFFSSKDYIQSKNLTYLTSNLSTYSGLGLGLGLGLVLQVFVSYFQSVSLQWPFRVCVDIVLSGRELSASL